jgi:hypothetical protein
MKKEQNMISNCGVVKNNQNPKNQGIADESSVSLEGHANGMSISATGTSRERSEAIRKLRDIKPGSNDEDERRGIAPAQNEGS